MTTPLTPAEVDRLLVPAAADDPVVRARRVTPRRARCAVLEIQCPFCGAPHWHGGGTSPGDGDGHRLAHCDRGGRGAGYVLREVRP